MKALSLLFILVFISCNNQDKSTVLNRKNSDIISVKTVKIKSTTLRPTINVTGTLTTENQVNYGFKIGGVIDKFYVEEGQTFKKGDLLVSLKLTEIESQLAQSKLNFEKVKRDYIRTSNLYKDSVYSLEQLQNSKTLLDIAQKSYDIMVFNKNHARVYAINDGFVFKKLANNGEVIQGGNPVLAVNETNKEKDWIVKTNVSEQDWTSINIGDSATISIPSLPNKKFKGFVKQKSLAADLYSGTYLVEIKMNSNSETLAVGMFSKIKIYGAKANNKTSIPYDAIVEANGSKAFVFTPVKKFGVKKLPITIESFNKEGVIIKTGLENVNEIIISNSAFLNEYSRIKIIN